MSINIDFTTLVEAMKKTEIPEGVVYEPSVESLESLEVAKEIKISSSVSFLFRSVTAMVIISSLMRLSITEAQR